MAGNSRILKSASALRSYIREMNLPSIRENSKLIAQFILTALFFGLGIWFLKHERAELAEVKATLVSSQWTWVLLGIGVTVLYIILQGLMYVGAFLSIHCQVKLKDTVELFQLAMSSDEFAHF